MRKLAVFFPGIGYTMDKPLLHYSRKLAAEAGFDTILLSYTGFPSKIKGDKTKMKESYRIAMDQAKEILSNTDFSAYKDILFIGKSIGTIVAAEIASQCSVQDRIRFVLFTPLEDTFAFPLGDAIAFSGTDDPWVAESSISDLCKHRGIPCHLVQNANHSLETGDVLNDIDNLKKIMKRTEKFIRHT